MAKLKLEELCEFITDGTHQTPEYCDEGGFLFLSSKDVTSRKIDWDHAKRIPADLHEKLYARLSPRKNDILLAKNGTTGVAALVDRDELFDVYVSLAVLRPKETVYPPYLLYAINSPTANKQFAAGLKGIGVPNLHLNVIRKTQVQIPTYNEQREICTLLNSALAVIEKRRKQLSALDDLIKARFVEMFGDEECKMQLSEVCSIITDGTHQPPQFVSDGIPFIFVSNITGNKVTYDAEKFIDQSTYNELIKRTPIEIGDVLLSTVGSYGHPAVVKSDTKFLFQRHIAYLKPKKELVDSDFLHGAILSPDAQRQIEEGVKGIAQKTLNLSEIKRITIPVPELCKQKAFAAFVAQIDKSKFALMRMLHQISISQRQEWTI